MPFIIKYSCMNISCKQYSLWSSTTFGIENTKKEVPDVKVFIFREKNQYVNMLIPTSQMPPEIHLYSKLGLLFAATRDTPGHEEQRGVSEGYSEDLL